MEAGFDSLRKNAETQPTPMIRGCYRSSATLSARSPEMLFVTAVARLTVLLQLVAVGEVDPHILDG